MPRRDAVPIIAVAIALVIILVLIVAARVIVRSSMPKVLRVTLLALESVVGSTVVCLAVAVVALSMGYWPFPFGPDGP